MKSSLFSLSLLLTILAAAAQSDESIFQVTTDVLEDKWETTLPFYDEELGVASTAATDGPNRRSMFWNRPIHYYISYGALSANRIPCPPRSGRSYYTHNCYRAMGPVHPYSRGCSTITRCRR